MLPPNNKIPASKIVRVLVLGCVVSALNISALLYAA